MESSNPSPQPKRTFGLSLNAQILLASIAGVAAGMIFREKTDSIKIIGDIFISLLKMILIPLILTSITMGIAGLSKHKEMGVVWKGALGYYFTTTALAVLTGLIAVNLFHPGQGMVLEGLGHSAAMDVAEMTPWEFIENFLRSLFVNPFASLAGSAVLPVVVFSVFLGIALVVGGPKAEPIIDLFDSGFHVIMTLTHGIMKLAPLGIFSLLAVLIGHTGLAALAQLGVFIAVVLGTTLFHGLITLPTLLRLLTGISPFVFFKAIRKALITAFSTSSSAATLPITLSCVEEELGVDQSISGFVLPLGATINMDGTALYEAMAALFIAALYGHDLSLGSQLIVFATAILASIGAPGIPSAGLVTMVMVLQSVGLPIEGIAILLSIDRILDTVRTTVNVEGDAIGALIINHFVHRSKAEPAP